jgi:ankyrin repeat protein
MDNKPAENVRQIIEFLINNGANVNSEVNSVSILQRLLTNKYSSDRNEDKTLKVSMLELLVNNGIKVNSESNSVWIYVQNIREAELLLPVYRSNLNTVDSNGKTLLHHVLDYKEDAETSITTYLIQQGAEVAPGVDIFALVRKNCYSFSFMEALLDKHPNYDVNTRDSEGRTLLLIYGDNIDVVNKLLALGGDPNVTSNNGFTPLHNAGDPDSIWKLMEFGADPLQYKEPSLSVVDNILEQLSTGFRPECFDVLKHILNLPQFKEITTEKKEELYTYIFKTVFSIEYSPINTKEHFQKILMLLYDTDKSIFDMRFRHALPQLNNLTLTSTHMFGLLGHAIVEFMELGGCHGYFYELDPFLCNVLDFIFSIPNMTIEQEDCISPLTVFLFTTSPKEEVNEFFYYHENNVYDTKEKSNLLKKLIEKGCNVNSMSLQISDQNLNELKQNLQVPDALLVSLLNNNKQYVETLIPYWWGPPLALLLFFKDKEHVKFWMPILVKYDIVPRGMSLCRTLHAHLLRFVDSVDNIHVIPGHQYLEHISK